MSDPKPRKPVHDFLVHIEREFRGTIGPLGPGGAVKKKRFSLEPITSVLQQVAGRVPVGDVCRQIGISGQTFYRWKKTYGGMLPSGTE
jgi:Transposase